MFKHRWFRVTAPSLIVGLWLVFAGLGGPFFGKISELSSTDLALFLPDSSESAKVNDALEKFNDEKSLPILAVFTNDDQKLTSDDVEAIKDTKEDLEGVEGVSGQVSPPVTSEDEEAVFVSIPLQSDADFKKALPEIKSILADANLGLSYVLTGPASFAHELQNAFSGIDGTLLYVALGVVFLILLCVYRSPFLPFIVLFTAMAALSVAVLIVYHVADAGLVTLNGQVQGILFILVIGAATDYSLLYTARYREELVNYKHAWRATAAALKSSFEPIIAAGGTVTVGLLCLLFSQLGSNKALGPVGGIGIALSIAAALTLLPVILALFGRAAFWPRRPKYAVAKENRDYAKNHPVWMRVGRVVQRHPRRIWFACIVVLVVAFTGLGQLKAEGVPQPDLVLGKSESRDGQKILDEHFPAGSGSPTFVLVSADKQDEIVKGLEANDGVDSVTVMATGVESGFAPVGKGEAEIRQEILDKVTKEQKKELKKLKQQLEAQFASLPPEFAKEAYEAAYKAATANIPSAESVARKAYPFKDAEPKVVDGDVMLQVTLKEAATSFEARHRIVELRDALGKIDSDVLIGGVTASQYDVNQASIRDDVVIMPMILVSITIILMLLLRSIVAPLLLLFTTVLSFGATLGVSALLFNNVWHFSGSEPAVILFAFVFLVALGIDYNIFLMTRVREETVKSGVRVGTIKGLVVTGGVITSAGVVLASTFASLSVIPILFLAQIAFMVTFGVLLDTIIVRSLLVPALTLEVGRVMWWPSKLWRKKPRS